MSYAIDIDTPVAIYSVNAGLRLISKMISFDEVPLVSALTVDDDAKMFRSFFAQADLDQPSTN